MNLVLFGVLAYVAVQLVIGLVVSRRVATQEDYLLAGRSLGPVLATASIFATWFGAETCVSSAGLAYQDGLSVHSTEPFAYALCLLLMGVLFATALWKRKLVTIADLVRERYSGGVERLLAILLVPTSVFWAAAQIRAFGQVLTSASELPFAAGIAIAAGVVILYTASGGMWADAVTDIVQGFALAAGLIVMAWFACSELGGPLAAWQAIDAERLSPTLGGSSWLDVAEAWAVPICGSVLAQELIARVSASRNATVARRSTLVASGLYLVIGLIPVFLGLLGPSLVPGLEDPEQVLPAMARDRLGQFVFILFAGALVSAILSTVDSTLLVAASLTAHNLIQPLRPAMSEPQKLRTSRLCVVAFGLIAAVLGWWSDSVFHLVELASGWGSSGVLVVVCFGLFTRLGSARSAYAALILGFVVYVLGTWITPLEHPYLASLATALVAFLAFGLPARMRSRTA